MAERLGYANPDQMAREMSASQLLEWFTYQELEPSGEELANIRAAQIVTAIWNVQIAKAQGAWDHSDSPNKGDRPVEHDLRDHILRFGDTPSYREKKPVSGQEQFERIVDMFQSWGLKPVKREP